MSTSSAKCLAIDIGGTKVAASVVSDTGAASWSRTWLVAEIGDSPSEFLSSVAKEARASGEALQACGVAIPAVLDSETDIVKWAPNLPEWTGLNIASSIRSVVDIPVTVEYDGHASALGEGWVGAGVDLSDFIVVAVGTGIGCGIVANGEVLRGADRLAGAAGWMIVGDEGSNWESQASSKEAVRLASTATLDQIGSFQPTPASLFEAARARNPIAIEAITTLGRAIGIGVANLVSILNPSHVVLTGGLGGQPELLDPVRSAVSQFAQPISAASVEILTSPLGGSSVLLGAAKSALNAIHDDPAAASA